MLCYAKYVQYFPFLEQTNQKHPARSFIIWEGKELETPWDPLLRSLSGFNPSAGKNRLTNWQILLEEQRTGPPQ